MKKEKETDDQRNNQKSETDDRNEAYRFIEKFHLIRAVGVHV